MSKKGTGSGKKTPSRIPVKSSTSTPAKRPPGRAPRVTPERIEDVRSKILATVNESIPAARSVLSGDIRWTNQQVKMFQILLGKVVPDLSSSMNTNINVTKTLGELSREDLEDMVRKYSTKSSTPEDAIDATFSEIPDPTSDDEAIDLLHNPTDTHSTHE